MIITPKTESFSIIYNKPVNIKSSTKFDIKILIVIAVLTFLLSYKLTSYLADFKILNNASRLDIIFLLIFFVLLFIPMSNINKAKRSTQENRTLAEYKPFINNNQINFNFGNDFNKWFNDRFYGRFLIIKNYTNLKYQIAINYFECRDLYINKKNNWVFTETNNNILESKENLDKYIENIIKFNNYCKKNNIKLYIFISPTKEYVYKEQNLYKRMSNKNRFVETKRYMEKQLKKENIAFIFPINEFRNKKDQELLFYKTDHHWTEEGAFIGYQILMQQIKKDFKDIDILDKNFFDYEYNKEAKLAEYEYYFSTGSSIDSMLITDQKISDSQYKYYKIRNSKQVEITKGNNHTYFKTMYNDEDLFFSLYSKHWLNSKYRKGKHKAFIIGNSYTAAITPYFVYTFKELCQRRYNTEEGKDELSIRIYKKDIKKLKPEILIICIHYTSIPNFKDLDKGLE